MFYIQYTKKSKNNQSTYLNETFDLYEVTVDFGLISSPTSVGSFFGKEV